jgi:AcrR family transcriptional regulator
MSSKKQDGGNEIESYGEGLRDRSKRLRQQRITAAAARLLVEKSLDDITTKELAAEAGVGEATLFRYIKNKHELLTLVYGDQLDTVLNRAELDDVRAAAEGFTMRPEAAWFIKRALQTYRARCDFYLVNPQNAALYLREGFVVGNPEGPRHLAQGDRSIRLVSEILWQGQEAGTLDRRYDVHIVAQNVHGTYMHEIDRTPVRGFAPETIWERLEPRLRAQLEPLAIDR